MANENRETQTGVRPTDKEQLLGLEGIDRAELLGTLARSDLEAAMAYDAVIEAATDLDLRDQLEGFRDDHLRHASELDALFAEMDLETGADEDELGPSEFLLRTLALASGPLGPELLIRMLLANEQVIVSTYASALLLDWSPEIREQIERARADEVRHRAYLIDRARELWSEGEGLGAQ